MATTESVVRPHASQSVPASPDRRTHFRAPLFTPALVDAATAYHRTFCRDVSVTGIALSCDVTVPVGRDVEIYFELPSGVAVETRAVVVRSGPALLALRFLTLESQAELALRAHCRLAKTR